MLIIPFTFNFFIILFIQDIGSYSKSCRLLNQWEGESESGTLPEIENDENKRKVVIFI